MSSLIKTDKIAGESVTHYGRTLLLHFACRAALPMGCSLRVTSTHLWAPGTLAHISDPTDAKAVSVKTADVALPNNMTDGEVDTEQAPRAGVNPMGAYAYASSVEMVTTPEDYPLWRTRTPVVVILRHHHGLVQHHRYRYMVVCPGAEHFSAASHGSPSTADRSTGYSRQSSYTEEEEEEVDMEGADGMGVATGSEDYTMEGTTIGTEVMTWEDPFKTFDTEVSHLSTASLPSLRRAAISRNLSNLPFRTLDIDTQSCHVMSLHKYSDKDRLVMQEPSADMTHEGEFTCDGIRIDTWNDPNDYSFRPYLIRDAINKDNKRKKMRSSSERSFGSQANLLDSGMAVRHSENTSSNNSGFFTNTDTSCDTDTAMSSEGGGTADSQIQTITTHVSFSEDLKQQLRQGTSMDRPNASLQALASESVISPRTKKQRIFFVCFHLPVILTRNPYSTKNSPYRGWTACWAESLLAATEDSALVRSHEAHWVGTVSVSAHDPIQTEEDRAAIRLLLSTMNCTPLFLEQQVQDAHYLGMCKQVLWPAFHNINLLDLSTSGSIHPSTYNSSGPSGNLEPKDRLVENARNMVVDESGDEIFMDSNWDQSRLEGWWGAYILVNSSFADLMLTMIRPGDIMWVHDYHLCLLPKMLDDKERNLYSGRSITKKVFFLHIPFPTSQIFRELECGEAILEGMLHADVVGFHAFDHARHFLTAAKRILGLSYDSLVGGLIGVQYGRKTVLVTMHNVSIEPTILDAALTLPSVVQGELMLRSKYEPRIIISGVDIAQRLSGVSLKLLAYEKLLSDYPIWQERVVLVQKCLIPNSRRSDEINTIRELRYLVRRIKEKFGPKVIDYEELAGSSVPIDQRLALWKTADVIMATPIREGLSLLPMEFIYTRKAPLVPGVIIWSEFSAVCSILNGALRVNPFDIQMTVTTMDKALTMSGQEREGRRFRDIGFVSTSPSAFWSSQVLNDLHDATEYATIITDSTESDDTTIVGTKFDRKDLITSTSAFLTHEHEVAFSRLDFDAVAHAYNVTSRRVLFLDLNGTIVMKEPPGKYLKREILGTSGNKPPQAVINALAKLCADERNTLFVVSGDSQENVENAIGNIPGLGLAASNGACFSLPNNGSLPREWKYFDLGVDWDAVKKIVLPILSKYTARTNGSFIKLTHSSIGWSYYSCDPEWGALQASHLILELEPALRPFDVRFVMIKGIVELVPRRLNKGIMVKNVLREVAKSISPNVVDFILCMGDDIHDEKMFTAVLSFLSEQENTEHTVPCPPVVNAEGVVFRDNKIAPRTDSHPSSAWSERPCFCFTTAVGKKQSHASTYVEDARDVAALLVQLTGGNQ